VIEYPGNELMLSTPADSYTGIGLNRDTSRACMVADTLAWAVSHAIPIPEALKSLPFYKNIPSPSQRWRARLTTLRDLFIPFHPLFWLVNIRWSWNLRLVIQDLEKGEPLSAALERNLRRYFPGFYLMGIAKAESDRHLDTALPVLARQLNFPASVASERKMEFAFAAWKTLIAVQILFFIIVMVVPKFDMIFEDLLGSAPPVMGPTAVVTGSILKISIFVLVTIFILSRIEGIGEYVLLHIPFVRQERKRFILCDLARSMAVFIRQGEDLLAAAEWSMKSTRSHWLRKRLDVFIASLRNGEDWVEAWANMKLGRALDEWLIRNAAVRQDPASGFELLAQWLHQEIEFTTRRLEKWIDPCYTLAIALIVGNIAYHVVLSLTKITLTMSGL